MYCLPRRRMNQSSEVNVQALGKQLCAAGNRAQVLQALDAARNQLCLACDGAGSSFNSEYAALVAVVLDHCLTPKFLGHLTKSELHKRFLSLFAFPVAYVDFFICLTDRLASPPDAYATEKLLLVFRHFLLNHFSSFLVATGTLTPDAWCYEALIQAIVSLPDRLNNITKGNGKAVLTADFYMVRLNTAMIARLEQVYRSMGFSPAVRVSFLTRVLGKLQTSGRSASVLRYLLPRLCARLDGDWCDRVWHRICECLFDVCALERPVGEALLVQVLRLAPLSHVARLLGDAPLAHGPSRHLLTHKLLLCRTFAADALIPEKLCAYLQARLSRRQTHKAIVLKLLDVWSDTGALTHSADEQRQYLCHCVLVLAKALTETERAELATAVLERVLAGVGPHLSCADACRRLQGMFVAQTLVGWFRGDGPPLEFDWPADVGPTAHAYLAELRRAVDEAPSDGEETDESAECLFEQPNATSSPEQADDAAQYDSDDDLQPLSQATAAASPTTEFKHKPPVYLRDCLDGLYERDDADKFDACFFTMERLIRAQSVGFGELCLELVRAVFLLNDPFSSCDFERTARSILIACCVQRPSGVAQWLADSFYARNYSVTQRLLALDVLTAAAEELACDQRHAQTEPPPRASPTRQQPQWRSVVDGRIASNTRRITAVSDQQAETTLNKFSPVAPEFFTALVAKYSAKDCVWMDLLGRDHLLLGRLLHCLGSVVYHGRRSTQLVPMAAALAELLWPLRFHEQPFVRQATLYAFSMLLLAVPPPLLRDGSLRRAAADAREWLDAVVAADTSDDCKTMARLALRQFAASDSPPLVLPRAS